MMKKTLALLIALCAVCGAYAQKAVITKKWIEHNVMENGVKGLRIHLTLDVEGMQGKTGCVLAYLESPKGTGVPDQNKKYYTQNGMVCTSEDFTPRYTSSTYSDFTLFFPLEELHLKPGKHTYYFDLRVLDKTTNNFLNGETYVEFSGTGNSSPASQVQNSGKNSNSAREQTWREELPGGMFAIYKGDPNGVYSRTIWGMCSMCRGTTSCANCMGTGYCTICRGQGGIITAGYGTYIPCSACGQTGRCAICQGTGKCICHQFGYPGYKPYSTMVIGPNGVISSGSGVNSGDGSPAGNSAGSSYNSCPTCGGRKYQLKAYRYAAASASGWAQPYHHYGGEGCPYCNEVIKHYHYPCNTCHGHGTVKR